jgi:galactoside O-acetyltransferase
MFIIKSHDYIRKIYQKIRYFKYWMFSDCRNVVGKPYVCQPVQLLGKGQITFKGRVTLGYFPSPFFFNGYIYIEARFPDSKIEIGEGVIINNNTCLISGGEGIFIGARTMIGWNCEILDSDFHSTDTIKRHTDRGKAGKVVIGENVLIGSNVKILRNVSIGTNSVISNGTVVLRSIPENTLAFGNPAKGGRLVPF